MLYYNVVITGSYLLLMFTSWKVWWELHSFRRDMSKPTREMNIQLTKVLLAQALIPLVFFLAPIFLLFGNWVLAGAHGGSPLDAKHSGLLFEIFTSFIVVTDPLAAILIIPGYRRALLRGFSRIFPCCRCTPTTPINT